MEPQPAQEDRHAPVILTAYAPSYLPWKGLLDRISQADVFVLCDTDRLSRKDFLTRNRVETANGPVWLTVPVLGSRDQQIRDVRIDTTKPWRRKHWQTIQHSYGKSPHWDRFRVMEAFYRMEWTSLARLNEAIIRWLIAVYGLSPRIVRASDHAFEGVNSQFIQSMCDQLGATRYICGEAGANYLSLSGVDVDVQPYPGEPLSAIHSLFREGPVL